MLLGLSAIGVICSVVATKAALALDVACPAAIPNDDSPAVSIELVSIVQGVSFVLAAVLGVVEYHRMRRATQ